MVATHHDPERFTARRRDSIGDETVCRNIQACNRILGKYRYPDFARWRYDQAIESARAGTGAWCRVGGEEAGARIEAEQEPGTEGGHPDDPVRVTGNLHKLYGESLWHKQADGAVGRIEATNLVVAGLGEPDHALWIDGHAIGQEYLHAPFRGEGIVPHETSQGIEPAQCVSVEFGEPDRAMCIKYQFIGRTGQRERLACLLRIGNRERGQRIEVITSRPGEVVSNVVGILFHKP